MADADHPLPEPILARPTRAALVGGALFAVLALVILDGGIAAWAQMTARTALTAPEAAAGEYSLGKHLLAMILLATFAVGIACTLIRERQRLLAAIVLIGTAAGPMTITAAPVNASVVNTDAFFSETFWWWHALVQGGQLLILALWTWWTSRCITSKRLMTADLGQLDQTHGTIPSGVLFSLYTATTIATQILIRTDNGSESPGVLPIIGWAVLGAGCAVIVLQSSFWPASGIIFISAVFMFGMLYSAYYRPGAWPGVAGWENGMEPPIILSFSTTSAVLAGPLAGSILRRRHPPRGALTASSPPEKADLR